MLPRMTASPAQQWVPEWSLADRLRRIRRELGLSQEKFAELLNVKPPRYGAWETGRNHPENVVDLARRIEAMTGVPAAWTLGVYSENPRPGGPDGGVSVVRHQGLEPRTR